MDAREIRTEIKLVLPFLGDDLDTKLPLREGARLDGVVYWEWGFCGQVRRGVQIMG